MKIVTTVMRYFAYLYHVVLALLALGLSIVALISGFSDLRIGALPFPKESFPVWLLVVSLIGLASVGLAVMGKLRAVFLVYALVVFAMLVYGYFLSHYFFSGPSEATRAVWITGGALLGLVGALAQFYRPKRSS